MLTLLKYRYTIFHIVILFFFGGLTVFFFVMSLEKDLEAKVEELGFVLLKTFWSSNSVLELVIEKPNYMPATIDDCIFVSKELLTFVDMMDLLDRTKYSIRVGSAGVNRELVSKEDYMHFIGKKVLIKLNNALEYGAKKFIGVLTQVEQDRLSIISEDKEKFFAFDNIDIVKLYNDKEDLFKKR